MGYAKTIESTPSTFSMLTSSETHSFEAKTFEDGDVVVRIRDGYNGKSMHWVMGNDDIDEFIDWLKKRK